LDVLNYINIMGCSGLKTRKGKNDIGIGSNFEGTWWEI